MVLRREFAISPAKSQRGSGSRRDFLRTGLAATIALQVGRPLSAVDTIPMVPFDAVEEDWELVIGVPDPETTAPQILNVITPGRTQDRDYAIFELNHITQPEYSDGGMQLQCWDGEDCSSVATPANGTLLAVPGELIRYTLTMTHSNGRIVFGVKHGQSQSWGQFGGDSMRVSCLARSPNLSEYRPAMSAQAARITFASHRVERFELRRVRYLQNSILVQIDEVPRTIWPIV